VMLTQVQEQLYLLPYLVCVHVYVAMSVSLSPVISFGTTDGFSCTELILRTLSVHTFSLNKFYFIYQISLKNVRKANVKLENNEKKKIKEVNDKKCLNYSFQLLIRGTLLSSCYQQIKSWFQIVGVRIVTPCSIGGDQVSEDEHGTKTPARQASSCEPNRPVSGSSDSHEI
jgi:hypothetical protein